ncbi:MAG TPA: lipoprotein [Planctomycetaceae bacterium]|jgi:hypothetical protein
MRRIILIAVLLLSVSGCVTSGMRNEAHSFENDLHNI